MSTTLFTLSDSWHRAPWMFERLALASEGDTILLIQDGVLALHSQITLKSFLAKCAAHNIQVVALAEDCELRGVDNSYVEVDLIDYQGFVDLVINHDRQVSW